jgi:sn-glycerol 3-phosphate transport system permease protein
MMVGGKRTEIAAYALLPVVAGLWLGPYAWIALTSLKTLPEILAAPTAAWPRSFQLAAYREVFSSVPIARYLLTTTVMAVAIALCQVALSLPAGYALAKLRFQGRSAAFGVVVSCLLVPAQVTFVPVFLLSAKVGMVNTMAGLVLPFAASAFGTFLVRQALLSIPDAMIEGTGVRWHIVMAGNVILSAPILVLFAFTQRHLLRAITARG